MCYHNQKVDSHNISRTFYKNLAREKKKYGSITVKFQVM